MVNKVIPISLNMWIFCSHGNWFADILVTKKKDNVQDANFGLQMSGDIYRLIIHVFIQNYATKSLYYGIFSSHSVPLNIKIYNFLEISLEF